MKLTTIIASTLGVGLFSLTSFAIAQDNMQQDFLLGESMLTQPLV